ncbi:MAG: ABC transporter permease [Sarcina sp.]
MMNSSMKNKQNIIISVFIWVLIWKVGAVFIGNEIYLPEPFKVFKEVIEICSSENFLLNIARTLLISTTSFTLSVILSVIIGVCSSTNKYVYNFIYPIVSVLKSIPTIIVILIVLIWFDKEYVSFLTGFIVIFPLLYELVIKSITDTDSNLIEMTKFYKIKNIDKVKSIYLPQIYRNILNMGSSSLGLVLKLVIASEVYSQPSYGIGALVQNAKVNFDMVGIFAWVVIIILISILVDIIFKGLKSYRVKRRKKIDRV